jgi:hypothetical protein
MNVEDPYGNLRNAEVLENVHDRALHSEPARYIQYLLLEHLADVEDNDDLDEPFTRGYRMALRVAFLTAGGQCDGSEEQWQALMRSGRG